MLHFTLEAEPKFETRRHPLFERFDRMLGSKALGLTFEPVYVSHKPNQLIEELEAEESAHTMTIEELEGRPDADELERFWSDVVADFHRQGGIDYAEE